MEMWVLPTCGEMKKRRFSHTIADQVILLFLHRSCNELELMLLMVSRRIWKRGLSSLASLHKKWATQLPSNLGTSRREYWRRRSAQVPCNKDSRGCPTTTPPRVNLANDPNTQSDHDSSFDEDLAPDLRHLVAPGGSFRVDRVELTKDAMRKYHTHQKGYVNPCQ